MTDQNTYGNILRFVASRVKYGESELSDASKTLEYVSEETWKINCASYNASYRKSVVHSQKLERAKAHFEKAITTKHVSALTRPAG